MQQNFRLQHASVHSVSGGKGQMPYSVDLLEGGALLLCYQSFHLNVQVSSLLSEHSTVSKDKKMLIHIVSVYMYTLVYIKYIINNNFALEYSNNKTGLAVNGTMDTGCSLG